MDQFSVGKRINFQLALTNGFKRGFAYYNSLGLFTTNMSVFSNGKLYPGLGKLWALYKDGSADGASSQGYLEPWMSAGPTVASLIAVCRLVESAKANIVEEFKPNQNLEKQFACRIC